MPSKADTITQYISSSPKEAQKKLGEMRTTVKAVVPGATEALKWGMPAFSYKRILVTFAAFKHHIGFYPTPSAVRAFKKELADYKTSRGGIQFPLADPLPLSLIRKITAYRAKEEREEDKKWRS